jgi:bacterioferritin-associated ferredoxin
VFFASVGWFMIVCVCNALCERRCQERACEEDCRTVGCIYRGLGCRVRCGKCLPFMREIFAAAKDGDISAGSALAAAMPEAAARP